jgi:hypothetical protein
MLDDHKSIASPAVRSRIRPRGDAGIAIGPILFVIAILGLLAAAIAAGSGSFTSSTTAQSNTTKANALIDIGQNTKVGMDRAMAAGGYDPTMIVADPSKTGNAWDLYAPTGGGVAPPSTVMALGGGSGTYDTWMYPLVLVKNIGSQAAGAGNGCRLMVLPVSLGVCQQVNLKTTGSAAAPAVAALGDFGGGSNFQTAVDDHSLWPFSGIMTGCVQNSSAITAGTVGYTDDGGSGHGGGPVGIANTATEYYFYQVLSVY